MPGTPRSFDTWAEASRVDVSLGTDLGADPGDWFLVRPDGYLAARGDRRTPVPLPSGYRATD